MEGESVTIQDLPDKKWKLVKVVDQIGPRSSKVLNEEGDEVIRNKKHLRNSKN